MIVKMLKYSFLVYHKEYPEFLARLRDLGVVHVIERQREVSEDVQAQFDRVKAISDTIKLLEKSLRDAPQPQPGLAGPEVLERAHHLHRQADQLQLQLANLRKEMALAAPWGDFSPEVLQELKGQGVAIRFYSEATGKFNPAWAAQHPLEVMAELGGVTYFVVIDTGSPGGAAMDANEVREPERPCSQLGQEAEALEAELEGVQAALARLASEGLEALRAHRHGVLQLAEYHRVVENTLSGAEDQVKLLEGWIPQAQRAPLEAALDHQGLVYFEQEPTEKDNIPVLLKNNRFAKRFEVLGELYTLPRYGELDLTPFFAPFYMIFFGFCLGDAGYGMLLTLVALAMRRRVAKEMRGVMSLATYLGLSTIAFGLIGGTFFGINLYATGLPVYSTLAAELQARDTDITMLLFYLALMLGGIQIIFGQVIRAVNDTIQRGWRMALGTYGWVMLLMGMATIGALVVIRGVDLNHYMGPIYALLGVSGVLIFPLSNLKRNPLVNIGAGLWDSYNMVTGLLGDLLSYIRLFALGIASAILGFVFNSLALSVSDGIPVLGIVFMVIILLLGHGINLFMSGLASFVHPLRLTFVEFYKNAGFRGGGRKYKPFGKPE